MTQAPTEAPSQVPIEARPGAVHCTQADFARLQGWAKSYVSKLRKDGRIVFAEGGLVDVDASLQRIKDTTRADSRADPAVMGPAYSDAKDRNEHYTAELNRIKLEREVGSLLDAAQVRDAVAAAGTTLRVQLEALPGRLAPQIAALPVGDEHAVRVLLTDAVHDILAELARGFALLQRDAPAGY